MEALLRAERGPAVTNLANVEFRTRDLSQDRFLDLGRQSRKVGARVIEGPLPQMELRAQSACREHFGQRALVGLLVSSARACERGHARSRRRALGARRERARGGHEGGASTQSCLGAQRSLEIGRCSVICRS